MTEGEGTKGLQIVKVRLVKEKSIYKNKTVTSPEDAVAVMSKELSGYDREVFCIMNLATRGQVINMNIVSIGTLNSAMVSPREVFKASILSNAANIILVHNHPSGDTMPSTEDISVTERLCKCGDMMDIPVLDHIIISGNNRGAAYSFKEHGLIEQLKKSKSDRDRDER